VRRAPSAGVPTEVRAIRAPALPAAPDDPAWRTAPVHAAELLPQNMIEPRLLAPSTPRLEVQAMTDGARVAFRIA
jgi:hypothetical protein